MSNVNWWLDEHVLAWNVKEHYYVKMCTMDESLIYGNIVHSTWLHGNDAMDDV